MTRVMASGVFDILHTGHVHYLSEAKKLGDELVVVVAADATAKRRKHTPIIPEKMRLELVNSLKPVDRAVLGKSGDKYKVVEEIRPDVIAIGYDQPFNEKVLEEDLGKRGLEVKVVRMTGYSDDLDGTRKIIRRIIEWHSSNCHGGDS